MNSERMAYNIKFLRQQNDWSQEYLAEQLSISRYVVIRWEANKVVPDIESLTHLSDVFNVTIDNIVGNHSFRDDLLKDFKRIYSSQSQSFDEEAVELVQYMMENRLFKDQIFRLRELPVRKQHIIHDMLKSFIDKVDEL